MDDNKNRKRRKSGTKKSLGRVAGKVDGGNTTNRIRNAYGQTKKRKPISSVKFWQRLANTDPNNAECQVLGLLTYLKLPYKFVGNAQFIIQGKCPDFIHTEGKKKIIELFGERWHKPEEEATRIEFFARAGYQVLIVWQKELLIKNRKNLKIRLAEFEELPEP